MQSVHAYTCGGKKSHDQQVSPEANVSRFPFIFFNLSGFSTLLVTTCLLKGLFIKDFYHGATMIDNTKTISCTVRPTYYAKTTVNMSSQKTIFFTSHLFSSIFLGSVLC